MGFCSRSGSLLGWRYDGSGSAMTVPANPEFSARSGVRTSDRHLAHVVCKRLVRRFSTPLQPKKSIRCDTECSATLPHSSADRCGPYPPGSIGATRVARRVIISLFPIDTQLGSESSLLLQCNPCARIHVTFSMWVIRKIKALSGLRRVILILGEVWVFHRKLIGSRDSSRQQ